MTEKEKYVLEHYEISRDRKGYIIEFTNESVTTTERITDTAISE